MNVRKASARRWKHPLTTALCPRLSQAIRLSNRSPKDGCRGLSKFCPLWIEEPTHPDLIVAGDNDQLPTAFFAAAKEEDDSEVDATGYESLMDMMAPLVRRFHLNGHYRSRDESLDRFFKASDV